MGALLHKADQLHGVCNWTDYSVERIISSADPWGIFHIVTFLGCVAFGFGVFLLLIYTAVHGQWKEERQNTLLKLGVYLVYIVLAVTSALYCYLAIPKYEANPKEPVLRVAMFGGFMLALAINNHIAVDALPKIRRLAFANTHLSLPEFPTLRKFEVLFCIVPGYVTFVGVAIYAGSGCHSINNHFRLMALGCGLTFSTLLFSWVWFSRRAIDSINSAAFSSNQEWQTRMKMLRRKIKTLTTLNVMTMIITLGLSIGVCGTSIIDDVQGVGMFTRIIGVILLIANISVQFTFVVQVRSKKVEPASQRNVLMEGAEKITGK